MELLALFLLAFVGAITPGPDILLVTRNTLHFGFIQGMRVFSGIASGWIVYLCVIYFGFSYILSGKVAQILLGLFGMFYLLYIAYMLFKKSATHITLIQDKPDSYLKAIIINLSNPKAILFFSVIVAPFIKTNPFTSLFVLFCGLSSAFIFVIILVTCFRHLIGDNMFHIVDKVCAILFICFAFLLFYHVYSIVRF